MGKQTRERQLKLEAKILKLKHREKELRIFKDRTVARFERTCQLLRRLNELREEQLELVKEKFRLTLNLQVELEVKLRLQQNKEEQIKTNSPLPPAKENLAENQSCASSSISNDVVDKIQRMEVELRCGICSELMVFATSLNCMHTFCQYCVTQWKNFEKNRAPVVGCPVCRESITSEKRNFSMDNIIGVIVDCYSEEEKNNRNELLRQHQELTRNLMSGIRQPEIPNPFYQITNRSVFMGEMRVEDIPTLPRINLQNVTRRRSLTSSVTSRSAIVRRLQGSVRPRWR